jgi:hypothetical protein
MSAKTYIVSDLFFTSWDELRSRPKAHALIPTLLPGEKDEPDYGFKLIYLLKQLVKNQRLVDKITVEQAVDIYNSLTFLNEPWYFFPRLGGYTPAEHLATSTFDHFVFADNEFTKLLTPSSPSPQPSLGGEGEIQGLARLAATLYMPRFDKEKVAVDALRFAKLPLYKLQLVFFTYGHVREFVIKRCKHLLPSSPALLPGEKGEEEQTKVVPTGPMWHAIKHQAARTLVFGDFVTLGQSNMYDVLDHLELIAKEKANAKP